MNLTHSNRVMISRQCREILPLRSPSLAERALLRASVFFCHPEIAAMIKPSPRERGDRSGASFSEARAKTREAIAVGEIYHTDALSRL